MVDGSITCLENPSDDSITFSLARQTSKGRPGRCSAFFELENFVELWSHVDIYHDGLVGPKTRLKHRSD